MSEKIFCPKFVFPKSLAFNVLSFMLQGRGKAGKKKAPSEGWTWDNEREDALRIISQLLELDVHRLWDPPVVEEEFVK